MQEKDRISTIIGRPRPTIGAALRLLLLAAAGLWFVSLAASAMAPGPWQDIAANALYYFPFMLLPIALYMRGRPGMAEAMRLNPMPLGPMLLASLLAVLSVMAATELDYLWIMLLNAMGLREPQAVQSIADTGGLLVNILNAAALPAVCEELLFRGFLFSAWESRGTWLAMLVSTVLFALLHGNLFGLPAYCLVGAISAVLVVATDSLYVGMAYHTVYNAAVLLVLYISSTSSKQADAAAAAAMPSVLSIVAEMAMVLVMMALVLAMILRRRAPGATVVPRILEPLKKGERALLAAVLLVMLGTMLIVQILGGLA